ncbi:MmgE/PrpD family protein [Fictibacillus enclensis]|uniref:MmgE/PrpD family protein n=1 Tax=Fictibacillus enclensis TaxID=1017270 RepID=UPI0025A2E077|nr:MmgE/PrpD family protein [Fictibacillus enclensis]MDM5200583.1 MmgE/PrpD family protein [Fictibacillus enclensis]
MVTKQTATNIRNASIEEMNPNAVNEAKRSLLNWLGVAIGAANHESMDKVISVAKTLGNPSIASVLGREEKVDMLFAALLNGMASHIYDFDDTLLETVLHPSAPVFPAILAYGEPNGISGKEVLESFIIGCEVEARLALTVYPSHYWRGWHITGTVGGIGAAAAISKLMNLDTERTAYSLGIAATDPTGLREMFGTMTKPYHPGKAAMNGLLAALLGEQGFTSSLAPLEAERGFIKVLSEEADLALLTEEWGTKWEVEKNSYKPFASGIVTHPAIDGIIMLADQYRLEPENIQSIEIKGHPLVKELTSKEKITTGLEGKFSVYHCVAAGLLHGKAGVKEFTDECVNDHQFKEIRNKTKLVIDQSLKEDQAEVQVTLKDGTRYSQFVEQSIGSAGNPMTDQQLQEKFKEVTGDIIGDDAKNRLIDRVYHFEELEDLNEFFSLCRPAELAKK